MKKAQILIISLLFTIMSCIAVGMVVAGNIDPDNDDYQYAYGENTGRFNLGPSTGPGVTVTDTTVTGYALKNLRIWYRVPG